MDMIIHVSGQKMRPVNNIRGFSPGTQRFVRFKFIFDSDWDGLSVVAQFAQDGAYNNLHLDSADSCYLPDDLVVGKCSLTLCGTKTSGDKTIRATTNDLGLIIDENMSAGVIKWK